MKGGGWRVRGLLFVRDRLPLRVSLAALRALSLVADVQGPWTGWARDVLELEGGALERWSRRAWWGRDASHALRLRLDDPARSAEAEALVQPVDWSPLERALAAGRGVLLVAAHVGPSQAAAQCVARRCPNALFLFWNPHPGVAADARLLASTESRRWALAEAALRLRDGGVVFWTADEGRALRPLEVEAFGRPVRLSRAGAALARATGATTLPIAAIWEGSRIRLVLGDRFEPMSDAPAEWDRQWLSAYARFVESVVEGRPENLRLGVGFWQALIEAWSAGRSPGVSGRLP